MADPVKIAAQLTPAQRKAVQGKTRWLSFAQAIEWPMCGLVTRMAETPHKWEATALGLAVRRELERERQS